MDAVLVFEDRPEPDHDIVPTGRQLRSPVRLVARSSYSRADLATRHRHAISSLLASREDLRGVYAFADVVEESVRWSA